jgi:hypothetical protein
VALDLRNLFTGKPKGSAEQTAADLSCIRRDTASRVQNQRADAVLDTLLPEPGGDIAHRFCHVAATGGHPDYNNIGISAFGDGAPLGKTASFPHAHRLAAVDNLGHASDWHIYLVP